MRIEGNRRSSAVTTHGAGVRGREGGAAFQLGENTSTQRAASAGPMATTAGIDALLALQGTPDPLQGKRKQIRRGRSLLDTLDALKADLLAGRSSDGHLNQLLALIGQARELTEPGLDALLDDIELRAKVELAKRGIFAGS